MQRALASERPLFIDHLAPARRSDEKRPAEHGDDGHSSDAREDPSGARDQRMVLLAFEVERPDGESHGLAVAAAPRVTLSQSVGPFALVYTVIAAIAAAIALVLQARAVKRAFRPLDRARDEAASVLGLGEGTRLTESGPLEVRALVAAMNALLERLEASQALQARFTAEAAHELRTPVTTMLGELDVTLRGPPDPAEYRRALESTREEVTRLRHLVEGLTALARIDAGQIDQGRERLRATELAVHALAQESKALALAGCRAKVEVEDDSELDGHRALLEVALSNLLRNAARHAAGSDVVLRVTRDDGHVAFRVDDAGAGVPEAERERLFDRFARGVDARRRDRTGLGLGLPLAREVARRHGGDCTLGASPLGGLRATLTVRALPREAAHASAPSDDLREV